MNADTKEPKKEGKKEIRKDDAKKAELPEEDGAATALSAIAGALTRAREGDLSATASEPDSGEPKRPRGSLMGGPSDAAAQALSAIARKHAMTMDTPAGPPGSAARPATSQSKRRSLFERVVESEDDLVGLIAFALTKQREGDWLTAFNAELGRAPREDETQAFLLGEGTDRQLRTYRQQAAGLLRQHTESVVADERPEVLLGALEGRLKSGLRWWKFIPAGVAGAVAALVILVCLVYAMQKLGLDPGFSLTLTAT